MTYYLIIGDSKIMSVENPSIEDFKEFDELRSSIPSDLQKHFNLLDEMFLDEFGYPSPVNNEIYDSIFTELEKSYG